MEMGYSMMLNKLFNRQKKQQRKATDMTGEKPSMERKTVFELYAQNNSIDRDFLRISTLAQSQKCVMETNSQRKGCSLRSAFEYGFKEWKQRGRCIDLNDYLDTIGFEPIKRNACSYPDSFLTYIEIVYNAWHFADKMIKAHRTAIRWGADGIELQRLMDEVLSEMNQKAYYDPETEQCLIGQDSAQVTSAAEATEPAIASQILQYNHRILAGNIAKKKAILINLAGYLEGRESELKSINKQLITDLNGAFNNLDIRHNNTTPRDSLDYKEKLANISKDELEKWYDDV